MRRRTTLLGLALASALSFAVVGVNSTSFVYAEELEAVDEVVEDTYAEAVSEDSDEELIVIDSDILTAERYAPEV